VSYRYSFEDLLVLLHTLRRRLTRSHSIVGALSMAICQWATAVALKCVNTLPSQGTYNLSPRARRPACGAGDAT
jgi:hypothetical protein